MSASPQVLFDLEQRSPEWVALRKTKITATDAAVIMEVNPWKNKAQLYKEKVSPTEPLTINHAMQRGIDLEPIALDLFRLKTGISAEPAVVVRDWAMASLDGFAQKDGIVVEIKCPGERVHALAVEGKIPEYYYPQLQHQLYVTGAQKALYFSFDGIDGIIIEVKRDETYIEKMVQEEKAFFNLLTQKTAPEDKGNYTYRTDEIWEACSDRWLAVKSAIERLEQEEEELRNQLIHLSSGVNSRGCGVSLCKVERKGNIDYSKIPELKNVDLEKYRKPTTDNWRLTTI